MAKHKSGHSTAVKLTGQVAPKQINKTANPTLNSALLQVLDEYDEAEKRLAEGKAILIERGNEPVAVALAYKDFEALLDELEDFRDAKRAREVLEAIRNGETTTIPLEQLVAELRPEGILDDSRLGN